MLVFREESENPFVLPVLAVGLHSRQEQNKGNTASLLGGCLLSGTTHVSHLH